MSWTKKITHPNELLKKGDNVQCVVLEVDQEKQRVGLGVKQLTEDPWLNAIPDAYKPGMVVHGKVTKITNFGVFVELEEGLEGLLHISELADHKVENPQDVVKAGDESTSRSSASTPPIARSACRSSAPSGATASGGGGGGERDFRPLRPMPSRGGMDDHGPWAPTRSMTNGQTIPFVGPAYTGSITATVYGNSDIFTPGLTDVIVIYEFEGTGQPTPIEEMEFAINGGNLDLNFAELDGGTMGGSTTSPISPSTSTPVLTFNPGPANDSLLFDWTTDGLGDVFVSQTYGWYTRTHGRDRSWPR
jgi:predicted RNA-binding protein with RPS1 domain